VHCRLCRVETRHCAGAAHIGRRADVAPRASEPYSKIRHTIMERRRFTAILGVILEHRPLVNIVLHERHQLTLWGGTEAHTLLGAGTMADRLKHHLAANNQLDWFT